MDGHNAGHFQAWVDNISPDQRAKNMSEFFTLPPALKIEFLQLLQQTNHGRVEAREYLCRPWIINGLLAKGFFNDVGALIASEPIAVQQRILTASVRSAFSRNPEGGKIIKNILGQWPPTSWRSSQPNNVHRPLGRQHFPCKKTPWRYGRLTAS